MPRPQERRPPSANFLDRFAEIGGNASRALYESDPVLIHFARLESVLGDRDSSGAGLASPLLQEAWRAVAEHPLEWIWSRVHARAGNLRGGARPNGYRIEKWLGRPREMWAAQAWADGDQTPLREAIQSLGAVCAQWPAPFPSLLTEPPLWGEAMAHAGAVRRRSRFEEAPQEEPAPRSDPILVAEDLLALAEDALRLETQLDWRPEWEKSANPVWLAIRSFGEGQQNAMVGQPEPLLERALEGLFSRSEINAKKLGAQSVAHDQDLRWFIRSGGPNQVFAFHWLVENGVDPFDMLPEGNWPARGKSFGALSVAERFEGAFGPREGQWALARHEKLALARCVSEPPPESQQEGAGAEQSEKGAQGNGKGRASRL